MQSNVHFGMYLAKSASLPQLICNDYSIQIRSLTGKHTQVTVHHKMRVSELKE
jgi:hypothetical protein